MAVIFNRTAGNTLYGTTPVEIPLSMFDESLGTARLHLREIPAGLRQELDDKATESNGDLSVIREIVSWGVADHDPDAFMEQSPEGLKPLLYQSQETDYHGKKALVASPDTLDMYQRVLPQGLFLHSIRNALILYHSGTIPTPRILWDAVKPKDTKPIPLALAQTP